MHDNAGKYLKEIRIKNINRIIIGTLNINSLYSKFDQLKILIKKYIDILVIEETKLDPSFPDDQWLKPYLSDRSFIVTVENDYSDPGNLTCGVPQGSILGPILLLLYVNDIPSAL